MAALELRNVRKSYASGLADTLKDIDLKIDDGEFLILVGPSGCGKSTLMNCIAGLEAITGGEIRIDGADISNASPKDRDIAMVFQSYALYPTMSVRDNIAFGLKMRKVPSAQIEEEVSRVAKLLQIEHLLARKPAQLSGGQKQRVGIARALATRPQILLCDEATSALDPQTTASVLSLLSKINRELGLTIVLITHEMDVIRRVCDRVAVLDAGQMVETGPVTRVFLHPQHPTTRRFVSESEHVDEGTLHRDFDAVGGRIVRLTFLGGDTYEPLLGRVARETGVDYNILSGRIDRIKDTPYGQLVVALVGGDQSAAQAAFVAAGVHVEELRR